MKETKRFAFPGAVTLVSAAVLATFSGGAAADSAADARIRELEKKLERSMQMIETLQTKVQTLEAGKAAGPAAAPANAEQAAKIDALEKQVAQLGSGISNRSTLDSGVPLHGFMEVGARRSGENNPTYGRGNKGFQIGGFDLYLTPQFGNNVRALLELFFEVDNAGDVNVDLERAQLGYVFNDALTVWGGRFHTPYGYWNTAFHHGSQIQTSILRPRFLDFEDRGGILPAHTTGTWGTGTFNLASAKLGYDVYAGNAARIRLGGNPTGSLNMEMSGNSGNRTQAGFNLWATPRALSALRVGVHGLSGTIRDDATTNATATRLNMYGGYATFIDDNWEILAEYYRFSNRDLSGGSGSHRSTAWYAQAGYNIGQWTPYARYEQTSLNQADNYFALQENGRSYKRGVVGLRYDLNPTSALKLELNRTRKQQLGLGVPDDSFGEAHVQFAVRF